MGYSLQCWASLSFFYFFNFLYVAHISQGRKWNITYIICKDTAAKYQTIKVLSNNEEQVAAGSTKMKIKKSTKRTNQIFHSSTIFAVTFGKRCRQGPPYLKVEGSHLQRTYAVALTHKYKSAFSQHFTSCCNLCGSLHCAVQFQLLNLILTQMCDL